MLSLHSVNNIFISEQAVRGLSSKDAEAVAELMAHKPETQRHYYVASQELREKVRAGKNLTSIMQTVRISEQIRCM